MKRRFDPLSSFGPGGGGGGPTAAAPPRTYYCDVDYDEFIHGRGRTIELSIGHARARGACGRSRSSSLRQSVRYLDGPEPQQNPRSLPIRVTFYGLLNCLD